MAKLTQTEYTRRYRARQQQRLTDLETELAALRQQIAQSGPELRAAYRTIDLLEFALTRLLGRSLTHGDLDYDAPEGAFSRFLRANAQQ